MALLSTDITLSQVKTETGSSSNLIGVLCNLGTINPYSFWGVGALSVDGSKNLVLTTPATNYKFMDFRLYNHTTSTPGVENLTHKWGPGGTTTSFNVSVKSEQLNIKEISGYDDYYTIKFYASSANRDSETSAIHTQTFSIDYSTVTLLAGHTRTSSDKADSPQEKAITSFSLTGITDPDTIYGEVFISTSGGTRVANLGVTRSLGYFTGTLSEYEQALMRCIQSIDSGDLPAGNSPAGYAWSATGSRLQIYTAATPKDSSSDVNQTYASSSYSFYWTVVLADTNSNFYTAGISEIDLKTYLDDGSMSHDQTIDSSASNSDPTTQKQSSGTISGASFSYDDIWKVYYDTSLGISYNSTYSLI